jgi:hypothetical protein
MKMKRLILMLCLVVAMGAQNAMAWSGFGHGNIAYVAEQHLTPEAKEKCQYYLRHSLAYYASWMDYWRGSEHFRKVNSGHSNKTTNSGKNVILNRGAMGHLANTLSELGNGNYKNLPDSVVRQRLINLIHYLPDMHCPSHVGISKKRFPQYAYKKGLFRNGKSTGYHGLWDGSPAMDRKGWEVEDYAKNVDKISRKQAEAWQSGTLEDWGRDLAKAGHQGFELFPDGTDVAKMSKKELKAVKALSDKQAMMGAYRLAYVLNTIFADQTIKTK